MWIYAHERWKVENCISDWKHTNRTGKTTGICSRLWIFIEVRLVKAVTPFKLSGNIMRDFANNEIVPASSKIRGIEVAVVPVRWLGRSLWNLLFMWKMHYRNGFKFP